MRNLLGLMLVTFCLSLLTTSCFAIQDVPKTEKIMFTDKDCHSLAVDFIVTDLKIAENKSVEFILLQERICFFESYNSFNLFCFQTYIRNQNEKLNKYFEIHLTRFNLPLKVGWQK